MGLSISLRRRVQGFSDEVRDLRRVRRGSDAGLLQGLALGLGGALATGDDRTGVAHRLALGGGEAGNIRDDRRLHLALHVLGSELLSVAAYLTYQHRALGFWVSLELLQYLGEVAPDYGSPPIPTAV